tara:strand:- start:140 stop:544 length:405 start_codon:yes stop_codon:yes gene_type:complete
MKRSEFKNKVKPIIKECIKELLFEEGVLSRIISEVIKSTSNNVVYEAKKAEPRKELINERKEIKKKATATKKKLLDAIGKEAFNGVNIFEGTTPMRGGKEQSAGSPFSNVEPSDPGVDISSIPGANVWKHLIKE